MVAPPTKTSLAVEKLPLDFTRTSSPDGRCDRTFFQFRALDDDDDNDDVDDGAEIQRTAIGRDDGDDDDVDDAWW